MKNFSKSMFSLMKYNINEMKKMINQFDFNELENELEDCKKSMFDNFNELKKKLSVKDNKMIIEVPYDRESQRLSFSITNERTFDAFVVPCDDCGNKSNQENTFSLSTDLPSNIIIESMKQLYNSENKVMEFVFETDPSIIQDETNNAENKKLVKKDIKEYIDDMVDMYNKGLSFKKIAEAVGVSDKTAAKWIKRKLNIGNNKK